MKTILSTLLALLLVGCSSQKIIVKNDDLSKGIVYVLPGKVQKLLSERQNNDKKVYYVLLKITDMQFRVYQDDYELADKWIENTNRYISISGKLYPLLFDFDEYFANTETASEFLSDYKAGIYKRTQKSIVRDYVYHVDFDLKGKIIYEGL